MKKLIKNFVVRLSKIDWIWKILRRTLLPAAYHAKMGRLQKQLSVPNSFQHVLSDEIVKHGPFAGMKFPKRKSADGALYPKLLGSFEREIHPLIEQVCSKSFSEVFNIGSSDGYYAVGFALRMEHAMIYAYDSRPDALSICKEIAIQNGVSDRIVTRSGIVTAETLSLLPRSGKALIFCDCEGCEKEIFTEDNVSGLKDDELIIEVHDLFDIEISSYLQKLFSPTHKLTIYRSIDDIHKAREYHYPELRDLGLDSRRNILAENRGSIMEWFHFTPH